jgi:predicted amidohydrolase YtcJ
MSVLFSRRAALLASVAAFSDPALRIGRAQAQQLQPADRIWSGGPILTMNDAAMRVEAVAERGGRIVAVGTNAEVMRFRGPQTQVNDLAGRCMIPGFIDPHGHIVLGGLQAVSANVLPAPDGKVTDIASMQAVMKEWVAANAEVIRRVNLIVGFGYDNAQLKELRHPNRDDLDAVSKDVPVVAVHQSGHIVAFNTKALEVTKLTAETPDPTGGIIRRREGSKEPDGVLEELAVIGPVFQLLGGIGTAGLRAFAKAGAEMWASFGYTTAQEGRANPVIGEQLKAVAAEGGFKNDIAVWVDVLAGKDFILANKGRTYTNRLRFAGGKISTDGSPQGFTAYRDRPYYRPVGNYPPGYKGYPTAQQEAVNEMVDWAFANDVHILTHCNGEGASDMYIGALRAAETKHGKKDRRAVLVHGQFLREDQVDSFKELGVMPALFPMHTFYWGDWHRDHTVGPIAADNISPTGWCRQRGMMFTSHHDAPVATADSMRVLDATVTRRTRSGDILGPSQRVDVITALKAMTIWAAYQQFEEASKGSIEVGKLADLVILSADPTAVVPETIHKLKVQETIKEGATIYRLTPEQQRRGEMMLPGGTGDDPFQRFINTASLYGDVVRTKSPFMRGTPGIAKAMASTPHDNGCISALLDVISGGVKL